MSIIKAEFEFNKPAKTCIVRNESIGGVVLGLINANFVPLSVSCVTDEELYLLHKNLPSLPLTTMEKQDLDVEADLFAYNLDQSNWKFEFPVLQELLSNLNFPNYLIAINAMSANPVAELQEHYKLIGKLLSDKGFYVDISRKNYRSYGGSEYRINTFILATKHPAIFPKMKIRRDGLAAPASVDYLESLKTRNGYPKDWQLDVLNDKESFRSQITKMEKCVLPMLVKIVADTIIVE